MVFVPLVSRQRIPNSQKCVVVRLFDDGLPAHHHPVLQSPNSMRGPAPSSSSASPSSCDAEQPLAGQITVGDGCSGHKIVRSS